MLKREIVRNLEKIIIDKENQIKKITKKKDKTFDKTWITLTKLINGPNMREFKDSFKNNVNYNIPSFKKSELLYRPKFSPSFIGTAVDILISYKMDNNFIFKYAQKYIKDNEKTELWKKIYVEAEFVTLYRAGPFAIDGIRKQRKKLEYFKEDIKNIEKLIDKQLEDFGISNMNIVTNPIFGSLSSGVRADGDFIFNDTLVEIKTSIKPIFSKAYVNQLIGYIALNESLQNKYEISSIGYWNPLYGVFYKTSISGLPEIINVFNKCKNGVINEKDYQERKSEVKREINEIKYYIDRYKSTKKSFLIELMNKYTK